MRRSHALVASSKEEETCITTLLPGLAMMMEGERTGEEEEEKAATVEGLSVVGASPHQPDPTIDENRRAPHPQI